MLDENRIEVLDKLNLHGINWYKRNGPTSFAKNYKVLREWVSDPESELQYYDEDKSAWVYTPKYSDDKMVYRLLPNKDDLFIARNPDGTLVMFRGGRVSNTKCLSWGTKEEWVVDPIESGQRIYLDKNLCPNLTYKMGIRRIKNIKY